MHILILWWLKHTLLMMAITVGLYVLGHLGAAFDFIRFPFKILLMLLVIEATPLGAIAGWLLAKLLQFFSFLFRKFVRRDRREI